MLLYFFYRQNENGFAKDGYGSFLKLAIDRDTFTHFATSRHFHTINKCLPRIIPRNDLTVVYLTTFRIEVKLKHRISHNLVEIERSLLRCIKQCYMFAQKISQHIVYALKLGDSSHSWTVYLLTIEPYRKHFIVQIKPMCFTRPMDDSAVERPTLRDIR